MASTPQEFQRKADDFRDELERLPMAATPDGSNDIATLHTLVRRYPQQARRLLDRIDAGLDT